MLKVTLQLQGQPSDYLDWITMLVHPLFWQLQGRGRPSVPEGTGDNRPDRVLSARPSEPDLRMESHAAERSDDPVQPL